LEKLEESVRRGGHCNSAKVPLFYPFLFVDFLFSEIGELLCIKSKYGPGGEFEPDWYVFLSALVTFSYLFM
jgi:hypothetical protein